MATVLGRLILIFMSHIGVEGVEMFVQSAVEQESKNENNSIGAISEIHLEANDTTCTPESMKHLLRFPIRLIDKLNLSVNYLNSESCVTLAHLVPHLKVLHLSDSSNIGAGGAVPLG